MPIVQRMFEKRDLSLSNPKAWNTTLWNLARAATSAGVPIDEYTALNYSAVFNAIYLISGSIATLPLHLMRLEGKKRVKAIDHSLYTVLHSRPNSEMSAVDLRQCMASHCLTWGNAYAEKVHNARGQIIELWPITPNRVTPKRVGGELIYEIEAGDKKIYMDRDKILHIPGFGFDGIAGYSIITLARESIALGLATEEFGAAWFGNGTHPSLIISHPQTLSPDAHANLKKELVDKYSGLGKAHRLMLLDEGMKPEKLGFSPEDSQFLSTRKFQVTEIARWYNVPPHKIKDLDRSTNNNIEEQGIEWVVDSLTPWLVRFEQGYDNQLLSDRERAQRLYTRHNVEGLLRGDSEARGKYYNQMFMVGGMSINEIKDKEDMNPIDHPLADEPFVPVNMVPLSQVQALIGDKQPPEENSNPGVAVVERRLRALRSVAGRDRIVQRYYPLIKDAAQRLINKESLAVKREVKKQLGERSASDMQRWLEEFYQEHPEYVNKTMGPAIRAFAEAIHSEAAREIGADQELSDALRKFIDDYTARYAERHIESSLGQLTALLRDDGVESLEERVDEWAETRADKIARDETVRGASAIAQQVFFAAGMASYWHTRGPKTCPYCMEFEGKRVLPGQSFVNDGDELNPDAAESPMKIRGTKAHPPLHQGCDCFISAW